MQQHFTETQSSDCVSVKCCYLGIINNGTIINKHQGEILTKEVNKSEKDDDCDDVLES